MHRAGKELVDFLRSIEFELNLSYLIKNRGSRLSTCPIPRLSAFTTSYSCSSVILTDICFIVLQKYPRNWRIRL